MKRLTYLLPVAVLALAAQLWTQPRIGAAGRAFKADDVASDSSQAPLVTLDRMGAYLRSLKAFQVEASTTRDEVLDDGQLIQFDSHINLLARLPDRLRVEVNNPRRHQLFFYDGKTFTMWAMRVNYYATVSAPPTIGKLADKLEEQFGISVPLEDLFLWGTPQSSIGEIKAAAYVGPSEIQGVTCDHLAFRQEGLDWQVWVQQGDYPLPRKLVLTTLTDDARPQYSSVLNWNLAPSFNEAAFQFDPPEGAHKIIFAKAAESGGEK